MTSLLSAKLDRSDSNTPWGFRLHGGKDFSAPLTIQRVTPGSIAAKCGLQVGDAILKIGDLSTDTLRHKEAQTAVIQSGNSLDLSLKRGASSAPAAPQPSSYHSPSPSYASQTAPPAPSSYPSSNYNVKPKPFGSSAYSDGLSAQTSQMSIGSGKEDAFSDRSSSHGSEDLPPPPSAPPPPPHAGASNSFQPKPVSSFSSPTPWKPSTPAKPGAPAAGGSVVLTPTQSAVLAAEKDEDAPKRAISNPSRTFRMLQQQVADGDSAPASVLSKGPAASQPAPTPAEEVAPKPVAVRQYNNPRGLYSGGKPSEAPSNNTNSVVEQPKRQDVAKQANLPDDGKKPYVPSETFKMVLELDNKGEEADSNKGRGGAFNPVGGKYGAAFRGIDDNSEYSTSDPNSPLYQGRDTTPVAPQTIELKNPTRTGPYPTPPQPAYQPPPAPKRPEPSIVGHAYPGNDVQGDTMVVQNRSTITIPSKKPANFGGAKAPKPFGAEPAQSSPKPMGAPAPAGGGVWRPNVPTGPRQMKVGRSGEARNMPATGGAGRIPMCQGCGTAIRGPFVLAMDKQWCPGCFVCSNPGCARPLIDIGFVEEEGALCCEKCYEQFMAPKCGKCGKAIIGEVVNAMKNTFCMNCFVCVDCGQPIGTGSFHIEEGRVYCQQGWAKLFQTKCHSCQFPIEPGDKWVEALNQNWHSECFNCSTCQINLEGQAFFAKAGKPYCKKHATASRFG